MQLCPGPGGQEGSDEDEDRPHRGGQRPARVHPLPLVALSISLAASRSLSSCLRSWSFLPRASASWIFAYPRRKYNSRGMSVIPLSRVAPISLLISRALRSSLRVLSGSRFQRLAGSYGLMCIPYSQTSPSSTRAKASAILTLPARIDLTSGPVRTIPASQVSRISYSWKALLFLATIFLPPLCALLIGVGM